MLQALVLFQYMTKAKRNELIGLAGTTHILLGPEHLLSLGLIEVLLVPVLRLCVTENRIYVVVFFQTKQLAHALHMRNRSAAVCTLGAIL